ncbi:hypothetical protein chiPu_0018240, partial [Chiloscyllium punctatum]|nr:hypothetical protein [Chiloscyllium punctatum]
MGAEVTSWFMAAVAAVAAWVMVPERFRRLMEDTGMVEES